MTIFIVFSMAITTMCLACYSNWFRKREYGWLTVEMCLFDCVARQVRTFELKQTLIIFLYR